jgi:hypothetical protein
MQASCLYLLHDQLGHPGRERTANTIKQNYQWIGLNDSVKEHCKECRFCKLRKVDNFRAKIPIQEYNRMGKPMDRVHADIKKNIWSQFHSCLNSKLRKISFFNKKEAFLK